MQKLLILLTLSLVTLSGAFAREHQMIDTLGVSPKGQFVALEIYGYKSQTRTYYVSIKVMNVWKKEYVGDSVDVEMPAYHPEELTKARSKAKILANENLRRFNISG